MSQDIADMPGIEAAMERFSEFEESNAGTDAAPPKAPDTRVAQPPDAPAAAKPEAQDSDSKPSPDTRAAADKPAAKAEDQTKQDAAKPDSKPEAAKPDPNKPAETEKSRYAKSQERLTKTWDQVNADKAALAADRHRLETDRTELTRQRAEFETIRKQAEQPQYKPEDYLNAAQSKRQQADHQRAEAKRLEAAGKFSEAERLEKLAARNEAEAEGMAEHAEKIRRNPPAGYAERQKQYEQSKQAWTVEAAKAFPDLAKEGSEFQQTVAGHLNALAKNDPQLLAHPSVIYHVSRLTAAEASVKALTAEAARVPVLVKEMESLRAKIKELEALTTPAGGSGVAKLGAHSTEETAESLRQAALEQGSLSR